MAIPTVATEPLLKTIRMAERFNEVVEAERSIFLSVATGTSPYESADLPANGTAWDATSHPNLKLEERAAVGVVSTDATNDRYEMHLLYRLQRPLADALIPINGSMTLQQTNTTIDALGNTIGTKHGEKPITNEVSVPVEGQRFGSEFTITTRAPEEIVRIWGNTINLAPFRFTLDEQLWRIANIDYDRVLLGAPGVQTPVYVFRFEFEYKAVGWNYETVFQDANGKIPDSPTIATVVGDYTKTICQAQWHEIRNFNNIKTNPFAP